jgi:hypothetical protein
VARARVESGKWRCFGVGCFESTCVSPQKRLFLNFGASQVKVKNFLPFIPKKTASALIETQCRVSPLVFSIANGTTKKGQLQRNHLGAQKNFPGPWGQARVCV